MRRSKWLWKELALLCVTTFISCLVFLWFAGCNNGNQKSDQQIQQQAAQATEKAKAEAQQAAAQAKVAAANAERKANDIAAGVREGLHNNPSPNGAVDINSATEGQLAGLPGITPARARRIINNRPYNSPHDLVSKGVVTRAEFDQISGQIVAQ